jgi:hypothetical protein
MGVFPAKSRRTPARQRRTRARLALHAVLIVSLWHAPVPWVHFHDLESPQVAQSEELSNHVFEFHSHDLLVGLKSLSWHAHLVLPWSLHPHSRQPDDEEDGSRPESDCVVSNAGSGNLNHACSHGRSLAAPDSRLSVIVTAAPTTIGHVQSRNGALFRQFLATFGQGNALRALTSVRLC